MGKIVLYGFHQSPPVRACLMTLNALNIDFKFKYLHVKDGHQFDTDFVKMNPLHTVPLLVDGERYISDSHVICAYLVQKYGTEKDQYLYPQDLYKRTLIDQRYFFDSGILFVRFKAVMVRKFKKLYFSI